MFKIFYNIPSRCDFMCELNELKALEHLIQKEDMISFLNTHVEASGFGNKGF